MKVRLRCIYEIEVPTPVIFYIPSITLVYRITPTKKSVANLTLTCFPFSPYKRLRFLASCISSAPIEFLSKVAILNMRSPLDRKNGDGSIEPQVPFLPHQLPNLDNPIASTTTKPDGFTLEVEGEGNITSPMPILVTEAHERWNYPRINMWRTLVTFFGLFVMGLNDAAYGVCLPLSYTEIGTDMLTRL